MTTETVRRNAVKVLFVDDEFIEFRALKKKIADLSEPAVEIEYSQSIGDALEKIRAARFDLILLDNRLLPNADFRETVPELRGIGYTGPIGVVSTDISGGYFQEFPDYMTQGESLEQLRENLRDLYTDLASGEISAIRRVAELTLG